MIILRSSLINNINNIRNTSDLLVHLVLLVMVYLTSLELACLQEDKGDLASAICNNFNVNQCK